MLDQKPVCDVALHFLQAGFRFHHAEPDYLMLVNWIPNTPDTLPANASHRVAVGAFVMNANREVTKNQPFIFCFPFLIGSTVQDFFFLPSLFRYFHCSSFSTLLPGKYMNLESISALILWCDYPTYFCDEDSYFLQLVSGHSFS